MLDRWKELGYDELKDEKQTKRIPHGFQNQAR
jgi:hypothetical protein